MKIKLMSFCMCILLTISLLSGCSSEITLQTELNSSQLSVFLYQGDKNGVFFNRSKDILSVSFIEEKPFLNTVNDTIYRYKEDTNEVSSHPFPVFAFSKISEFEKSDVKIEKSLVNRVNLLFINKNGMEYYLVPQEDHYEIVKWDSRDKSQAIVSSIQLTPDKKPMIWNPLQLFSWKIFIHDDSKQLCFWNFQTEKLLTTNSNMLPEQIYEGKDYLLFSSQNYSSYLLFDKTTGDLEPIGLSGKCICHNENNNIFGFFREKKFSFFNGSDPYDVHTINITDFPVQKVYSQRKENELCFFAISHSFTQSIDRSILYFDWDGNKNNAQQIYNLVLPDTQSRFLLQHKNIEGLGIVLFDDKGLPGSLVWFNPWKEFLHEYIFSYKRDFQNSKVNLSEMYPYLTDSLSWNMILTDGNNDTSWIPWFSEVDISILSNKE